MDIRKKEFSPSVHPLVATQEEEEEEMNTKCHSSIKQAESIHFIDELTKVDE